MNRQPLHFSISLSPEITTNALLTVRLHLYLKQREKRIRFPQIHRRSHFMPCQVQSLKLQGRIFTSHCCKAWILVITSIYFNVFCVGYSLSNWMKDNMTHIGRDFVALSKPPTVPMKNSAVSSSDSSLHIYSEGWNHLEDWSSNWSSLQFVIYC